ncbi:MAG: recombinase RecA [Candidatus Cloacimonetes bacterium]|nr:recombinase RecA [Candidatus Cloacimonadota bacterium]
MASKTDNKIDTDKIKSLSAAMDQITRTYGQGAIMRLGSSKMADNVEVIPTGSLELDQALGIGGFPRGRIVEIYGNEASGKTTLTLHAVANAQKAGGVVAFIDAEHALDPQYAKAIGVDIENLLIAQPASGEEALEIVDTLVRSNAIDLIVVDSVAALTPKSELEGEMGDSHVGLQARLLSQAMRKLTGSISRSRCCAIFINQIRMKIGGYGNPETTTGGNALKFYASMRLEIRKTENLMKGTDVVGTGNKVKVCKNKLAAPFKVAEFEIMYGEGISYEASLLNMATENGIVKRAGTWFSYEDIKLGQGKENVKLFLKENLEVRAKIEAEVKALLLSKSVRPGSSKTKSEPDTSEGMTVEAGE